LLAGRAKGINDSDIGCEEVDPGGNVTKVFAGRRRLGDEPLDVGALD
jgi:hypothetical protein